MRMRMKTMRKPGRGLVAAGARSPSICRRKRVRARTGGEPTGSGDPAPAAEAAADGDRSRGGPVRPPDGGDIAGPPPRAGSAGSLIAFAAMGAVIVLLGGYLLMFTDWLPSPGRNIANDAMAETERLAAEIETLQAEIEANAALDLAPLAERVTALEEIAADIDGLQQNAVDLTAAIDADRAARAEIVTDLDALRRDVIAGAAAGGDPEAAARLTDAIDDLSARIALLETAGPPEQMFELQRRLEAVETAVATLTEETVTLAAAAAERDQATGAARLLAFNNVWAAADRGDAFSQELAILAELGVGGTALDALQSVAIDGVPSRDELAESFEEVADAIIEASVESDPDAGFWDRLWDNARGIVIVTPTTPVEGDDPPAIVSRMRAAVDEGDLQTALAERAALPDVGIAASADWAAAAEARLALDAAIADLAAAVQGVTVE